MSSALKKWRDNLKPINLHTSVLDYESCPRENSIDFSFPVLDIGYLSSLKPGPIKYYRFWSEELRKKIITHCHNKWVLFSWPDYVIKDIQQQSFRKSVFPLRSRLNNKTDIIFKQLRQSKSQSEVAKHVMYFLKPETRDFLIPFLFDDSLFDRAWNGKEVDDEIFFKLGSRLETICLGIWASAQYKKIVLKWSITPKNNTSLMNCASLGDIFTYIDANIKDGRWAHKTSNKDDYSSDYSNYEHSSNYSNKDYSSNRYDDYNSNRYSDDDYSNDYSDNNYNNDYTSDNHSNHYSDDNCISETSEHSSRLDSLENLLPTNIFHRLHEEAQKTPQTETNQEQTKNLQTFQLNQACYNRIIESMKEFDEKDVTQATKLSEIEAKTNEVLQNISDFGNCKNKILSSSQISDKTNSEFEISEMVVDFWNFLMTKMVLMLNESVSSETASILKITKHSKKPNDSFNEKFSSLRPFLQEIENVAIIDPGKVCKIVDNILSRLSFEKNHDESSNQNGLKRTEDSNEKTVNLSNTGLSFSERFQSQIRQTTFTDGSSSVFTSQLPSKDSHERVTNEMTGGNNSKTTINTNTNITKSGTNKIANTINTNNFSNTNVANYAVNTNNIGTASPTSNTNNAKNFSNTNNINNTNNISNTSNINNISITSRISNSTTITSITNTKSDSNSKNAGNANNTNNSNKNNSTNKNFIEIISNSEPNSNTHLQVPINNATTGVNVNTDVNVVFNDNLSTRITAKPASGSMSKSSSAPQFVDSLQTQPNSAHSVSLSVTAPKETQKTFISFIDDEEELDKVADVSDPIFQGSITTTTGTSVFDCQNVGEASDMSTNDNNNTNDDPYDEEEDDSFLLETTRKKRRLF